MTRQLVIEYVLDGHRRGYDFTSSTHGFADDELKLVWRSAMPRGQGWGQYAGARSLKCFPLGEQRRVAVCETSVTDTQDENGRGGIRRAVIDVLNQADYFAFLDLRLMNLPNQVRARLDRLPTFGQRLAITNSLLSYKKKQLVLLHPFTDPDRWQLMEGLVIKLALDPIGPMRRWGRVIPFTTLALNHQDEAPLVALPLAKSATVDKKTPSIRI
ncbi:MAG TPA: hypothetical protein VKY59_17370 [Spirillospora sp.]|nr:hypothetical protein [Spirillospora sp.]